MSIVEDGLVLVGVGLDETADDRACELLVRTGQKVLLRGHLALRMP